MVQRQDTKRRGMRGLAAIASLAVAACLVPGLAAWGEDGAQELFDQVEDAKLQDGEGSSVLTDLTEEPAQAQVQAQALDEGLGAESAERAMVDGNEVSVDDGQDNVETGAGIDTAEAMSLPGGQDDNSDLLDDVAMTPLSDAAPNSATVTLAGWTYGAEPKKPVVDASFGRETAVFSYASSEDGPYVETVPTNAGTYWVKATIAATEDYDEAQATAQFTIAKRPMTVYPYRVLVEIGAEPYKPDLQCVGATAEGDDILDYKYDVSVPLAQPSESGSIIVRDMVIWNELADKDVTANYDIAYVPSGFVVADVVAINWREDDHFFVERATEAIYALYKDIWMTVDEAGSLIALGPTGRDKRLVEMFHGRTLDLEPLEGVSGYDLSVAEDGGFSAEVGEYELVLKAKPEQIRQLPGYENLEVRVTAHVTPGPTDDSTTDKSPADIRSGDDADGSHPNPGAGSSEPTISNSDAGSVSQPSTSSTTKPDSTRKAALPATGDSTPAFAMLFLSLLAGSIFVVADCKNRL